MCWVFRKEPNGKFSVGYFLPNGEWYPVDDFPTEAKAAHAVHYLNGGMSSK
jgi:hypothetical protein